MKLANPDGSGDGWAYMPPAQPRNCLGCGLALRVGLDTIWFRMFPRLESWCDDCTPKWVLVRGPQVFRA